MMQKKFGQFSQLEDENPTGSQVKSGMPPITGSPMPNAGMKNKTMGSIFPAKDDPSVKQAAGRKASAKRLKGLPNRSPLGPITGGPQKPQARPQQPQQRPGMQQGQQQQPDQDAGTGDQWMGELWQGLTLNEQPQGGFAMGGAVNPMESNPSMDMYNQVTRELESGGVSGYAHGGMVEQSREIASKGRNGDSMLMHINPQELSGLQSLLGPVTVNPETGNPEAFLWTPLLVGMAIGATVGGASAAVRGGDAKDIALATVGGGTVGALTGGVAGLAAPAAVTAPTVTASAVPSILSGGSLAVPGSVAPGILGAGGAGAGTSFLAPGAASAIANSVTPAAAGMSKAVLSKAAASGLSALSSQGQQEQQAPMAPPPSMPAPSPLGNIPSPYEKMRQRRSGISSVPGSRSVI